MNDSIAKREERASFKKFVIALICLLALCIGGVFAYLTATDTVTNRFTVAQDADIEVLEPNWDEEKAKDLLPREEVDKDPQIHNKSDFPVYVFAEVNVPVRDILVTGATEPAPTEVFTYEVNDGWTLKDKIVNGDSITYRYAWTDPVDPDGITGTVFDTVTVCDFVNSQLPEKNFEIVVTGHGIQATFDDVDTAYVAYFGEPTLGKTVVDIVVNDDAIEKDSEYDVLRAPDKVIASATAPEDDQVIFEDVPVVEGETLAVVPDGSDEPIIEFTVNGVEEGTTLTVENKTAYAVYDSANKTLNFYKRAKVPSSTSTETVYVINEENCDYTDYGDNTAPWFDDWDVDSITVVDEGIRPTSLAGWFVGSGAATFDLAKLDTSRVVSMNYTFSNCTEVEELDLSTWDASSLQTAESMIVNCLSLQTIYANNTWNSFAENGESNVFQPSNPELVGGQGSTPYNVNGSPSARFAHIDGGESNPGFFTAK